jgi:hypothetical protein
MLGFGAQGGMHVVGIIMHVVGCTWWDATLVPGGGPSPFGVSGHRSEPPAWFAGQNQSNLSRIAPTALASEHMLVGVPHAADSRTISPGAAIRMCGPAVAARFATLLFRTHADFVLT